VTATELAALIVAITSVVAVVLLAFCLLSITRTMKEVRAAVELMRTETMPVVMELNDTVRSANAELERVDGLLGTAESISGTVDSASRLAYLTFSNPVIKAVALASGTGRAAKAIRRKQER
jgi:uncharacterized protein YoxC